MPGPGPHDGNAVRLTQGSEHSRRTRSCHRGEPDGIQLQLAVKEQARRSKLAASCHQPARALGGGTGAVGMISFFSLYLL